MSIFKDIADIDKKFAWGFFGFVIGVLGICLAIYTTFFHNINPNISYKVLTNTNIIDVKESISNLDILYNGKSLDKDNSLLKIFTIKVINNGNKAISQYDYDINNPIGIHFNNATIVDKPIVINTSNNYLTNNLKILQQSSENITFSNVILESDEYFIIKILLICKKDINPTITPIGKILGVKEIKVNENFENSTHDSFVYKLFNGNIFIHILRFIIYIFLFILLLIVIILPAIFISDKVSECKRKKLIRKFRGSSQYKCDSFYEKVFDIFLNYDLDYLVSLKQVASDKNKLNALMNNREFGERTSKILSIKKGEKNKEAELERIYLAEDMHHSVILSRLSMYKYLHSLKAENIISDNNNEYIVDMNFLNSLSIFIDYVKFYS